MKIEREVLEDKLKKVISDNARNRKIVTQVTNELQNKNMMEGEISPIFKLTAPISGVNDFVLYAFTKALFNATREIKIDPTVYFTPIEIEDGDKWKQEVLTNTKDKQPITFKHPIKINNNTWIVVKTIQELYDLFNIRTLVYNANTQRPLKVSETNKGIIEKIDINNTAVHQIEDLISTDLYFQDPITINALNNQSLHLEESKNGDIIFFSGELNIIDGWHRLRGMFRALVKNPKVGEMIVPITLTRLTESRALDYIHQKSKNNPIDPKFTKTIDPARLSNQILDHLNAEKKSLLKGKITKNLTDIKSSGNKSIVEFNTIADSIDFAFNPKEQTEIFELSNFIMKGLNHIINIYSNLAKEYSEPRVWCSYICMLSAVKDIEDWETVLDDLLLNFDINNVQFKAINKIGVRNIMIELNKFIPVETEELEEGVDNNE